MIKTLPRLIKGYFSEVHGESKKIAWPTQKTVLLYSAFVIGACILLAVYFGLADWVLTLGVDALIAH